jgi:adenosine deaminase
MIQKPGITWFERVPKVELHLHLEGAIPYEVLWELVKKYGGDPDIKSLRALKQKFVFRDFPHFLEMWRWKNRFIRDYEDFELIGEAVASDLANQNIRYVEAFYTPADFFDKGLQTQKITEAIRSGLDRVPSTKVMLITDLCRDYGPDNGNNVLSEISEIKDLGVIGIGIGGSEQSFPPGPYAGIYERARKLGFHTTAHAGEAAGPESVWGAIRSLKVERIGHGTRIFEDAALVKYVAEKGIPVEVCPISNVKTRVVESIKKHPVRGYFDKGMVVTINTDDPKMFGNSLAEEYQALCTELGFTTADIQKLIQNGINASWLPQDQKIELSRSFIIDPDWQINPGAGKS